MRESLRGSGAFYDEENEGFPDRTQRLSNIACTRRRAAVIDGAPQVMRNVRRLFKIGRTIGCVGFSVPACKDVKN